MRIIILILMMVPSVLAGGKSAKDFTNFAPDFREYLESVEHGLIVDEQWRSWDNTETTTANYSDPTNYHLSFDLVDSDSNRMQWFNGSVESFTISTSVAGTFAATLTTDILTFRAGRAAAAIEVTGDPSIGSTITVSAPTFTQGVASVSTTASRILTFTE